MNINRAEYLLNVSSYCTNKPKNHNISLQVGQSIFCGLLLADWPIKPTLHKICYLE